MTIHEKTLEYLYREQRKAKHAYGHAENRPGVTLEELENLAWKIKAIDYCIPLVLSASHETPLPVAIIKRALVEVKRMCENTHCIECPFHINSIKYGVVGCPMQVSVDYEPGDPSSWEIDDWEEK